MGRRMIFSKERDLRLVTVRRGGTLQDADHHRLAVWAADCAEHVLRYFEHVRPGDDRPRRAMGAGRPHYDAGTQGGLRERGGQGRVGGCEASGSFSRSSRGGISRASPSTGRGGLRDQGRARGGS